MADDAKQIDRLGKIFDFTKSTLYNGMSKLAEREFLFALFVVVVSYVFVPELIRLFAFEVLGWDASETLVVWSIVGFSATLALCVMCSTVIVIAYIWSRTKIKIEGEKK